MKSNIFHVNIFMILLVAVVMSGCSGNIDRIIISDDVNTSEAGSDSLSASGEAPEESVSSQSQNEAGENAEPQDVYVYVCGEVAVPGVYILKSDSRIYDAICMAGGFTENAAEGYINLAETVTDGAQYTVYSYDEVSMMSSDAIEAAGDMTSHYDSQGRLNINNATLDELMQLKGIGQAKAEAIIQYRDEYGGFTAKEELLNVSGIGDGVYSGIEADITVGK